MSDLKDIIQLHKQQGWFLEISEPTSHIYAVARKIFENQNQTLLFRRIPNYETSIIAGVCGTRQKIARNLGVDEKKLAEAIRKAMDSPSSYMVVGKADFLSNCIEKPDVGKILPILRFYPRGERRYLSSTIIAAKHKSGATNFSFHRMMLIEGNRFAVRVVPRHLYAILENSGGTSSAIAFCGVHPAVEIAAAVSLEPDVEEAGVASWFLDGKLRCIDMDGIIIPAEAEVVMVGRFTGETADEGPFVDLTGTYDDIRQQPVFEVDRLYLKNDFIYRTILPGGSEHKLLMGLPQEGRMLRMISCSVPSVVSVALTEGGCGWLHAVVSIRKMAEGEGKTAGLATLASCPSLKMVTVVDEDINPADPNQVEWAIATRLQPDRDIHVMPGMKGSSLDPSRNLEDDTGAKWILDATVPMNKNKEAFIRVVPPPLD